MVRRGAMRRLRTGSAAAFLAAFLGWGTASPCVNRQTPLGELAQFPEQRHSRSLLFLLDVFLGQQMRDALVAVDAGLAFLLRLGVIRPRTRSLLFAVHRREAVAVAALARVARLHLAPLVGRELHPLRLELLFRVDVAHQLAVELARGLDLAHDLVSPVLGDVAIGAHRTHARPIRVMHRLFVFLEDGIAHLVARRAEFERVGRLHRGVEATPKENAADHSDRQHRP